MNSRRSVALATAVASLALTAHAHAASSGGGAPTLSVNTTVAGQTIQPLVDGAWKNANGIWTLALRSESLPMGQTVAQGGWRTPMFAVGPNQLAFAASFDVTHQGESPSSSRYSESFRICVPAACSRWISESADEIPQHISVGSLPFVVSFGRGIDFRNGPKRARLQIQWRFRLEQDGTDAGTTTINVAGGKAASGVRQDA